MPPSLLPFLYQTRTIQYGARLTAFTRAIRRAHSSAQGGRRDNSIPFDWEDDPQHDFASKQESTITPSEAEIFKGIFDEIAQGRMPASKKRLPVSIMPGRIQSSEATASQLNGTARSIVDQARLMDFRDKFLSRYPSSLRDAAQVALGLFELPANEQGGSSYMELKEADAANWAERAMYDQLRSEERARVEQLMDRCTTDAELWDLMEREVFTLPERLGIVQQATQTAPEKKRRKRVKAKKNAAVEAVSDGAPEIKPSSEAKPSRLMDIHGRLYPHFINHGLKLFDMKFARSSPYAFKILPRVKELGLPSYVLGVSTLFYSRLAYLYWTRFGDSNSALNILQEMLSSGLYANEESQEVVERIRDHLHGCTWGAQGPFVMAMMESSPYDASLSQRLENMLQYIRNSILQEKQDSA